MLHLITKRVFLSLFFLSAVVLNYVNAMTIEVGTGAWKAAPSGYLSYGEPINNLDVENKLGLDSKENAYFYADISHPVPIIPNLRIERQQLKSEGKVSNGSVIFGNSSFSVNTDTSIDLTQSDFIFYWKVPLLDSLSNGVLNIDFGIDAKKFDGSVTLSNGALSQTAGFNKVVPLGYGSITIDPPFIPISITASTKYISYKESSLSDTAVKISMDVFTFLKSMDVRLDIGYKQQSFDVDKKLSKSLATDIDFSGVFAGISVKF